MSVIVSVVIAILLYALAIWVVGKFGLGLKVSGFGPAFIAAIVIAIVSYLIIWLMGVLGLGLGGGFLGAIIHLIIAALVLIFAGNMVKGLVVKGFVGGLIATVAIAVVSWFINGVVGILFYTENRMRTKLSDCHSRMLLAGIHLCLPGWMPDNDIRA